MDYSNPAECLELLRQLPLTDVDKSQAQLALMVATLLQHPPAANQHLEVLEAARGAIAFVQGELGSRYAAHPLPPDSVENETLKRVLMLWQDMAQSYALVLKRDAEYKTLGDQHVLLAQRKVHYRGQCLIEYFRAHRAVPPGLWTEMHAAFVDAERLGAPRVRVADPLNDVWKAQSCSEAYITVLLADLANPFGRSQREFNWVCRWAQRFAPYCALEALKDDDKPAKYGLDVVRDHGLRPLGILKQSPSLRRFDGSRLAGQIQAVLTQFKQGVSPSSLGLGEDCPTDAAKRLLLSLYRPWGLASAGRRFPRRGARGVAELACSWPAAAFYVQGKPFEPPSSGHRDSGLSTDLKFMTFGAVAEDAQWTDERRRQTAVERGYFCQTWQVADQSVGGFRIVREPRGERVQHHQLVAIRPPDGTEFLLGCTSWLMYREDGQLEAGIHMLPGIPEVVAIRPTGVGAGQMPFQLAFLLPAVPALKTSASLVISGGAFQAARVLELRSAQTMRVRMEELVSRGSNYDQVSISTAE
jgi:hypothetical protein